jgi:hypothetical protein
MIRREGGHVTRHGSRGRIGLASVVALGAVVAFAAIGGTSVASGLVKPAKKQYGGQYNNASKVTVCHKGKVTIRIAAAAVPAHKAHGDAVGACTAAPGATAAGAQSSAKPKKGKGGTTSSSQSSAPSETASHGKAKGKSKD